MTPQVPGSEPSTHTFGAQPAAERSPTLETAAPSPGTLPEVVAPLHQVHPVFGDYELLHVAGEGGMGVVYQARRRDSDRIVALKTMKSSAATSPELAARFQREIRTADAVRHAHIVPVLDVGEIDGRLFYTMPYAPTNLGRQRQQFRDPRAAAAAGIKIARALQFAHSQGIIHRDLKPSNILLNADGEPLIADFGLARWVDASQVLTQSLAPMGTPAYMAPEQASGPSHELSGAADIWSLGVILYELLTGLRPFEAPNADALFFQIRSAAPQPLRAYRPELDAALESIVLTCLCKDRAGRYATAAALADDLDRWLDGKPVRAQLAPTKTVMSASPAARGLPPRARALVVLGVAMVGLMFWGAAAMVSDRSAPLDSSWSPPGDQQVRNELNRLTKGLDAHLVKNGNPLFQKLLIGAEKDKSIGRDAAVNELVVSSSQDAFVALAPAMPVTSYRIDADMSMELATDGGSLVGIIFGWDSREINDKSFHAVVLWHWNDLVPETIDNPNDPRARAGNAPALKLLLFERQALVGSYYLPSEQPVPRFAPAIKGQAARVWRRVRIDITDKVIHASLDGAAPPFSISLAACNDALKRLVATRAPALAEPWTIRTDGPIGLAVSQARARVRSFTISTLSEK